MRAVLTATVALCGLLPVSADGEPARPIRGELSFQKLEGEKWAAHQPLDIGREPNPRRYLTSGSPRRHSAVWAFKELPADLAKADRITAGLNLDFLWLTAGEANRSAEFRVTFTDRKRWDPSREAEYQKSLALAAGKRPSSDELAKRYGRFEVSGLKVAGGKEPAARIALPISLFADLRGGELEARVECRTTGVLVGFRPDDMRIDPR